MISRVAIFVYGLLSYAIFFVTFLYALAFVEDLPVPRTIDSGEGSWNSAKLLLDVLLLGIFAVQHSVMARPAFKRLWTKAIPPAAERSTYVLASSLALILLFWLWQPLGGTVWSASNPALRTALLVISLLGWGTVLVSTFLISHFELFGLTQIAQNLRGKPVVPAQFRTPLLYRFVRHPIYFGFLIGFWVTPQMSYGHLLFAVATTGYIFIGIFLEERDLVAAFGDTYRQYRQRVPMVIPFLK